MYAHRIPYLLERWNPIGNTCIFYSLNKIALKKFSLQSKVNQIGHILPTQHPVRMALLSTF